MANATTKPMHTQWRNRFSRKLGDPAVDAVVKRALDNGSGSGGNWSFSPAGLFHLAQPVFGAHQLFDVDQLSRIIACVARVAIILPVVSNGLMQSLQRKIAQRVRLDETPDLLDRIVGGDQLGKARRIDAIETRRPGRRTRDPQVHLARSRS